MNEPEVRAKMQKAVDDFASSIASLRTGRPTPALIQNIQIPAYGGTQKLTLQELANINTQENALVVEPWDGSIIGDIKKGLESAGLSLAPQIDGEVLRLSFPPLTGEDRQKMVKTLNAKLESTRVTVRQIRLEAMKEIKQGFEDKQISEDEKQDHENKIQLATDEYIENAETLSSEKEKELLTV